MRLAVAASVDARTASRWLRRLTVRERPRLRLEAAAAELGIERPHTAESWNAAYPVGTHIRYWPVLPPVNTPPICTTTRSEAWALGNGAVVVLIVGKAGGVSVEHCEVTAAELGIERPPASPVEEARS